MPCGSFEANAVFFAIGALAYNLYLGFRGIALDKEWERSQGQTVRWRLVQTAAKIVRHGRQVVLTISASPASRIPWFAPRGIRSQVGLAAMPHLPRSASVARASCGKEAPFPNRPDSGRGIFALLGGRTHRAADCEAAPKTLENAGAER